MKQRISLVFGLATALAVGPFASAAQPRPDFSGIWVVISPPGQGEEQITHTPAELRVEHASEGGHHSQVYKLDGTETREVRTSHGAQVATLASAKWESGKLVVEQTTTAPDGHTTEMRTVWFLDAEGRLIREITVRADGQARPTLTVVATRK
jgi:hypothetical protein